MLEKLNALWFNFLWGLHFLKSIEQLGETIKFQGSVGGNPLFAKF